MSMIHFLYPTHLTHIHDLVCLSPYFTHVYDSFCLVPTPHFTHVYNTFFLPPHHIHTSYMYMMHAVYPHTSHRYTIHFVYTTHLTHMRFILLTPNNTQLSHLLISTFFPKSSFPYLCIFVLQPPDFN